MYCVWVCPQIKGFEACVAAMTSVQNWGLASGFWGAQGLGYCWFRTQGRQASAEVDRMPIT